VEGIYCANAEALMWNVVKETHASKICILSYT